MDHMEYSIALPPCVELTNAGAEWTKMKQRLFIHLDPNAASFHHMPSTNLSNSFLVNISLDQAQEIFNMYGLSIEETAKFNKILKSIEDICLPRLLIIYNRYRFFTCKQNGPEFNGFLQQLLAWSDLCEFGDLKDILLKDCIISGISEESVRQHLLRTEQLDFDKTVEICKAGLVKKHGPVNVKSKSNRFKDAWTVTVEENIQNNDDDNLVLNTDMADAATNTEMIETSEKEIQTGGTTEFAGYCFETLEDNHTSHGGLISDSIINTCISTHPLFVTDYGNKTKRNHNSIGQIQSDILDNGGSAKEEITTEKINGQNEVISTDGKMIEGSIEGNDIHEVASSVGCFMNEPFQCSRCSLGFSNENSFQEHIISSHPGQEFKCSVCDIVFADEISLNTHSSKHTNKSDRSFQCKSCSSAFKTAAHLKVHTRLHTGERPFVCDTCGKGYAEASKLKIHLRSHTGERPYKCPDCTMTFKWSAAFNRHRRTHTGERPYKCEIETCNANFPDITSLQRHSQIHTMNRSYFCMCGSSFTDPSALRVHKRIHTGERPYSCTICSASFVRAQHLKNHTRLHSGEKPYECETCHAKFAEASKLKSHKRKHTGEKPYVCKVCGRSFSWTAAYSRHLRTHTLERPYVCRVCGSAFADNSTLVRHRRIHTGERPFRCTHCFSTFSDSSSLSRHLKIHTGIKAFTCDICSASFCVKAYLTRHLRIHTGKKRYECDECDSKFSESSKLNRHKKIHQKPVEAAPPPPKAELAQH